MADWIFESGPGRQTLRPGRGPPGTCRPLLRTVKLFWLGVNASPCISFYWRQRWSRTARRRPVDVGGPSNHSSASVTRAGRPSRQYFSWSPGLSVCPANRSLV